MITVDKHWEKECVKYVEGRKRVLFQKVITSDMEVSMRDAANNAMKLMRIDESNVTLRGYCDDVSLTIITSSNVIINVYVDVYKEPNLFRYKVHGKFTIEEDDDICELLEYFPKFQSAAGFVVSAICTLIKDKEREGK